MRPPAAYPLSDGASIDVASAATRLSSYIHRTPLLSSRQLGEIAGGQVFLKCENLQRAGSFKIRGALNAVLSLPAADRSRGVVTYSSGNHGQALALAARIARIRAVVCMPTNAAKPKIDAARAYGAEVRFAGTTSKERKLAAEEAVRGEGLVMVPPFDDPRIIEGQATVGLEIAQDCPDASLVLVPTGGGGLLAGTSLAVRSCLPAAEVHGVEPTTGNAMAAALQAGKPVEIAPPRSIADGLLPVQAGVLPHRLAGEFVARMWTVEDAAIEEAMRFLLLRCKLVVEPSGAVGVALLLSKSLRLEGRTAVLVLSGGNVEPERIAHVARSEA